MVSQSLPVDIQDAARQLARRHVASVMVGGFAKTAGLEEIRAAIQNSLGEQGYDTLKRGLIGAGVGGAGGYLLNSVTGNRKRKSPWASALTGAAVGGGIGAASPMIQQGWNALTADTGPTQQQMQAEAANDAQLRMDAAGRAGPGAVVVQGAREAMTPLIGQPASPARSGTPAKPRGFVTELVGSVADNPGSTAATAAATLAGSRIPNYDAASAERAGMLSKGQGGASDATIAKANKRLARIQQLQNGSLLDRMKARGEIGRVIHGNKKHHGALRAHLQRTRPGLGRRMAGRGLTGLLSGLATHYLTGGFSE